MAKQISMKKNLKLIQFEDTEMEKQRMIDAGIEYISLDEMKKNLSELGLRLNMSQNFMIYYYNTMNEHYYLEASTQPVEKSGKSCYSVNSDWYNTKDCTVEGDKLMKLRTKYFTTIIRKGREYILNF